MNAAQRAERSPRKVPGKVLVTGGWLLDPSQGVAQRGDVALLDGVIDSLGGVGECGTAPQVIDASGLIVTPGLIDLHTHLYWGATEWGIDGDDLCTRTGVTTAVDAGSAGASTLPGFGRYVVEACSTRVHCFIHISRIGLPWKEELAHGGFASVERCVEAARSMPDTVVGVKVRASVDAVGQNGEHALRQARAAADELKLPLMVHISHAPPSLEQILAVLEPGDIITHAFTSRHNRLLDEDGLLREDVQAALDRGVLLDIGHGMGSFSFATAERLLGHGVEPSTISTDVHAFCLQGPVHDLPTTMSKLLHLGLDLSEVVTATTSRPATAIGRGGELGVLRAGAAGDLALLEVEQGEFELVDSDGERRHAKERIRVAGTIRAGELVFDARSQQEAR